MGKSTASCFKIIACGGDPVDRDDLETPESEASSDRNRLSFRKRSVRHRVLSNTVISEAPYSPNKQSPDSTPANFQAQPNSTVLKWTEDKNELSSQMDPKFADMIASGEDDCRMDATLEESGIILIQAAIRGYLAQRVLSKQKNVIKLQAVVRGHLVRRHAVETLRCVKVIVKMQALVRARHNRRFLEGSGDLEKLNGNSAEDNNLNPTLLRSKKEAKPNGAYTYTSIEKLLSNKFACQLLESTPRTKHVNIKCDPLKSGSEWKWLERWTSVSSASKEQILVPSDSLSGSKDFNSENDDNLITYDADNLDLHACSRRYDVTESGPVGMIGFEDTSIPNASAVQTAGSECGTELSISSTLDSPDRSEAGDGDFEHERKNLDETSPLRRREDFVLESVDLSASECVNSVIVPENQEKCDSNHKIMASQSSSEQLQKESKSVKSRKSNGSAKPDREQRDGSSSYSLPSYMQATESARAKAISNGSPRSSPDVQDKDILNRNRHSLPVTNGRQGSPRIHHFLSHSPQDRKWQR